MTGALPKVLLVWSRPEPGSTSTGRDGVIRAIREALQGEFDCVDYLLKSRVDARSGIGKIWSLCVVVSGALVRGLPIQVALFSSRVERARLLRSLRDIAPAVVYFDTVRCATLVGAVRDAFPLIRVVVDFDDLMSRRYEAQAVYSSRTGIRLGYLDKKLGPAIAGFIGRLPSIAKVLRRESRCLANSERRMLDQADVTIVLSAYERELLVNSSVGSGQRIRAIPPPFGILRNVSRATSPFRFVFVGSDSLLQNALAIDYLLKLWERVKPVSDLVIYGRQSRNYTPRRRVRFAGFEPSFDQIYDESSIVLVPAVLPGGIKTKVAEALAYGRPIVANPIALEGFPDEIKETALCVSDDELADIVIAPDQSVERLVEASAYARELLSSCWSPASFKRGWREALTGVEGIS